MPRESKVKILESKVRTSIQMKKRKMEGSCKICKKAILPGDTCFYYDVEVKNLQYPLRRYICVKCHDEIASKPHEEVWFWLISYFGRHYDDLEL